MSLSPILDTLARWVRRPQRVLILSDHLLTFYSWHQGVFIQEERFPQDPASLEGFSHHLDSILTGPPVHWLVDLVDEELKTETMPRLRGNNRTRVIQRRLEQLFRELPYRRADTQGRAGPGRERILYSCLGQNDRVLPWMTQMVKQGVAVAGLWSVPLLSRELLREISRGTEQALLVTMHATGLRQTFFQQGRTLISRMTPIATRNPETGGADTVREELNRTRAYLQSLRLLASDAPLEIFFLHDDHADWIPEQATLEPGCRAHRVAMRALGERLGWTNSGVELTPELLFAQLLLRRQPPNHYARVEETKGQAGGVWPRLRWAVRTLWQAREGAGLPLVEEKPASPRRLGDWLLEKRLITQDQLQTALIEQKRTKASLGKTLIVLGLVPEGVMRKVLADYLSQESVDLNEAAPAPATLAMVPRGMAMRHGIFPTLYDADTRTLVVAMANPLNVAVLDKLQARLPAGIQLKPALAGEGEITSAIDRFYGVERSVAGIIRELETGEMDWTTLNEGESEFSHPMMRLVDALLIDAVKRGASDIHIGPTPGFVRIRLRLDGVLRRIYSLHRHFHAGLVVRLKVMAGMNIAETRIPQDGHIVLPVAGRNVNFRVSLQPVVHGENIVIRVLDPQMDRLHLERLGMNAQALRAIRAALSRPDGLILVTGPTGSGKTTTLYAMMQALNSEEINIMTMEDPVEYPLATILQTHVNKQVGLDYAAGVRSMLWQDPDVILVGEIHDAETAQMALQAAMTGHKVFSTLHAHSVFGAIPRLQHLGVAADFLAGNVNTVMAQRLVRRLCSQCRQPVPATPEEQRLLGMEGQPVTLFKAGQCADCDQTGYKGRFPILEILRMDDDFDALIHSGAPQGVYRALAMSKGFRTILDDAISHLLSGATDLDEIARVLDLTRYAPQTGN